MFQNSGIFEGRVFDQNYLLQNTECRGNLKSFFNTVVAILWLFTKGLERFTIETWIDRFRKSPWLLSFEMWETLWQIFEAFRHFYSRLCFALLYWNLKILCIVSENRFLVFELFTEWLKTVVMYQGCTNRCSLALQPGCEEMEREWGNEEEMEREWGNEEEIEREWGNVESQSLSISSFSLHFLLISSFSLHFLAARLQGCNDSCSPVSHPSFSSSLSLSSFSNSLSHLSRACFTVILHSGWGLPTKKGEESDEVENEKCILFANQRQFVSANKSRIKY